MKLQEIADAVTDSPQADGLKGDGPVELKDVVKYFPNNHAKAIKALAKAGRLTFGGEKLFNKGGDYGPALDRAVAEAEEYLKDEEIELRIEMDGTVGGIDEHGEFDLQLKANDVSEVYVGYATRGNKLLIGFDVWLGEEDFNEEWDSKFEREFGEDFDMDNDGHEKIFNKAWIKFRDEQGFMGALVEVSEGFKANMDEQPVPAGFYRGIHRRGMLSAYKTIDLRLD